VTTCRKCDLLTELYEESSKSSRAYWVMTELFVLLHGGDSCGGSVMPNIEQVLACPFCDHAAERVDVGRVRCSNQSCEIHQVKMFIADWQRRPMLNRVGLELKARDEDVARLKAAIKDMANHAKFVLEDR